MTAAELVVRYLQTLQAQGQQSLPLDQEARAILRQWMRAAKSNRNSSGSPASPFQQSPLPSSKGQEDSPSWEKEENIQVDSLREVLNKPPLPTSPQEEENIPYFRPGGHTPEEIWNNFERLLPNWAPLLSLGTLRSKAVPGEGNRHADIMLIGDAPNFYDERAGRPFQGEAGGKLDGMLKAMGLSREQVYITHFVKFRPALPHQTTNNRAPNEKELLFSGSITELEIKLVQPRVIVALGIIAARGLLRLGEMPLSAYQQRKHQYQGIPVVVTHHPSYLLRTNDIAERRRLWEGMLQVMEIAHLPISDKQRGYFLKK